MSMLNTIVNTCELTRGDLGTIAYYSHLIPVFLSLILGVFVYIKAKYNLFSKIFLLFVINQKPCDSATGSGSDDAAGFLEYWYPLSLL